MPPIPPGRDLSDAVIEIVKERMQLDGWSGKRLAAAAGMLQPTLAGHLRGEGCLSVDKIDALAEALGTDLQELLGAAQRRL